MNGEKIVLQVTVGQKKMILGFLKAIRLVRKIKKLLIKCKNPYYFKNPFVVSAFGGEIIIKAVYNSYDSVWVVFDEDIGELKHQPVDVIEKISEQIKTEINEYEYTQQLKIEI